MDDPSLVQYIVDQGFDMNEMNEDRVSNLDLVLKMPSGSKRIELLAALHRRPPTTKLMSEGMWNVVSTTVQRLGICSFFQTKSSEHVKHSTPGAFCQFCWSFQM